MIRIAAIMARGLGSRMRRTDVTASLDGLQASVADSGVKGMIPIAARGVGGTARPFLDYVISSLADVGITEVVIVLGPEHDTVREYYVSTAPPTRVRVRFALQAHALGTANAVIAAADVIGDEPFLVLNADNYYPSDALRRLVSKDTAATVAFDRDALVRDGNIDRERVRAFAVLDVSEHDTLRGLIEKPGETLDLDAPRARWVGMNCWVVTPAIVDACRRIPQSVRGEYELPEAVSLALREGTVVRVERVALPVLDLSQRADIPAVVERLAAIEPRP